MVQQHVISRDREILGGTPRFVGTRVPVNHSKRFWTTFQQWNVTK